MPPSAASDLGLNCVPMYLLWDARHKWVNASKIVYFFVAALSIFHGKSPDSPITATRKHYLTRNYNVIIIFKGDNLSAISKAISWENKKIIIYC